MKHRIQVDFDIEADSHGAAFEKVLDWMQEAIDLPEDTTDYLVVEENEEICDVCK